MPREVLTNSLRHLGQDYLLYNQIITVSIRITVISVPLLLRLITLIAIVTITTILTIAVIIGSCLQRRPAASKSQTSNTASTSLGTWNTEPSSKARQTATWLIGQ